uniref:PPM-type phosphatase domain-containing protein n=1 Tax=Corethron hystrix TaxID=216773 RepID=A0A7S1FNP4_9STRA|mmetsp:Transcript_1630/g.3471  ORF Transcript_1630/g.3471 Transcript_1630/m.3471 type:complete len:395 (+) Transcript_1630:629-1813(+)
MLSLTTTAQAAFHHRSHQVATATISSRSSSLSRQMRLRLWRSPRHDAGPSSSIRTAPSAVPRRGPPAKTTPAASVGHLRRLVSLSPFPSSPPAASSAAPLAAACVLALGATGAVMYADARRHECSYSRPSLVRPRRALKRFEISEHHPASRYAGYDDDEGLVSTSADVQEDDDRRLFLPRLQRRKSAAQSEASALRGGDADAGPAGAPPVSQQLRYRTSARAIKGYRPYMEDEYAVALHGRFAGVYDGHGGGHVSTYLRQNLHAHYLRALGGDGKRRRTRKTAPTEESETKDSEKKDPVPDPDPAAPARPTVGSGRADVRAEEAGPDEPGRLVEAGEPREGFYSGHLQRRELSGRAGLRDRRRSVAPAGHRGLSGLRHQNRLDHGHEHALQRGP